MFDSLDLFRLAGAMARHAGQGQALAAQNVANADTPGYRPARLPEFRDLYGQGASGPAPRATRPGHLNGQAPGALRAEPLTEEGPRGLNGNGVSLEVEMLHSVAAKRQHDRALAIYRHGLTLLRSTIQTR
jgi:flagellar basal-body rod protein FlgB